MEEGENGAEMEKEEADGKAEIVEDDADVEEIHAQFNLDRYLCGWREDPNDPSLSQRHSPLLLFLHALASKQSFVHLKVHDGPVAPSVTPFVMDNMPMWPHLLCLDVASNSLRDYCLAPYRFPSLTSPASPTAPTPR